MPAPDLPSKNYPIYQKLFLIKLLHSLIWLMFNVVFFYLFYSVLINDIGIYVWIGIGLILMEAVVLFLFAGKCPLTILASRFSDSRKDNFDIFLPLWLAKNNQRIYTVLFVIFLLLLSYRLIFQTLSPSFWLMAAWWIWLVSMLLIAAKRLTDVHHFNNNIKQVLRSRDAAPQKIFSFTQLSGLPAPVQKYFRLVLTDGQPYISTARLKHTGLFKTGINKKWITVKGEQYFNADRPAFIWKGATTFFTAFDSFINGTGAFTVLLLSLFPVVKAKGDRYNEAELVRWMAESAWFPTNLLPSENLQWTAESELTATLQYRYNEITLNCRMIFNPSGEIARFETSRFYDGKSMEKWSGTFTDYQKKGLVLIPVVVEAAWEFTDGPFSYAKFILEQIEYDIPERF